MLARVGLGVLLSVFMVLACLHATAGGASAAERRIALVIGNERYDSADTNPGAATSADTVAEGLRSVGFQVTRQIDLDHRAFRRALSRFQEELAQADLGAFYYAGMVLSIGRQNFILPSDARLETEMDVMLEAIELDPVLEQIRIAGYRSIVAFDPVVPNPIADRLAETMGPNGGVVSPILAATAPRDRMIIVYAQQPDKPPVPTETGSASLFANALAGEISKPVSVEYILQGVGEVVASRSYNMQELWLESRLKDVALLPMPAPVPVPETAPSPGPGLLPPLPGRKPLPPPAASPPEEAPYTATLYATRDTSLLQEPNSRARALAALERAEAVSVTGTVRILGTEWKRAEKGGKVGYVQATLLAPAPPGDLAAPVEPAPDKVLPGPTPNSSAGKDVLDPSFPQPVRTAVKGALDATRSAAAKSQAGSTASAQARQAQQRAQRAAQSRGGGAGQVLNGDSYKGEGEGSTKNGYGVYRFSSGELYEGEWRQDAMTGYGVYHFPGGGRFEGMFVNGKPQGAGIYHFADRDVFYGEVVNGRPSGNGELLFSSGDRYQGETADMLPNGLGTMTYGPGDQFVGTFRRGQADGPGVRIVKSGGGEDRFIAGVWLGTTILHD